MPQLQAIALFIKLFLFLSDVSVAVYYLLSNAWHAVGVIKMISWMWYRLLGCSWEKNYVYKSLQDFLLRAQGHSS